MTNTKRNRHRKLRKPVKVILSCLLIFTITVGGTLAYLSTQTNDVVNTFTPSHVDCKVTEDFNGTTKSNVNVTNTSDIEAYIRVKLVSYRVNSNNEQIGGLAEIAGFPSGSGWVYNNSDGFYYYTLPVSAGAEPETDLIGDSGILLEDSYTDADGGKQVIEVMAEAIQSKPNTAVEQAWKVTVDDNGNLTIPTTEGGN